MAIAYPRERSVAMPRWRVLVGQVPLFPSIVLAALVVTAVCAPALAPHSPTEGNIVRKSIPPVWVARGTWENPLGTDRFGRHVRSCIIDGGPNLRRDFLLVNISDGTVRTLDVVSEGDRGDLTHEL